MESVPAESAYMFSHALLQRACYELMLPSVRAELHRQALEFLHTHHLATPEELAGHALAGQAGAPAPVADRLKQQRREFLQTAVEQASAGFANERCLALLEELFLCDDLSASERVQLLLRRSEVLNRMGRMDDAVFQAEAALKVALELGTEIGIAQAQLALGRCCIDTASNARAPGLLTPAVEALRRLENTELLELGLSSLSRSYFTAGKTEEALAPALESTELALATGNESRAIKDQLNVMTILAQLGRMDEAGVIARKLSPMLESSSNPEIRGAIAGALASFNHGLHRIEESAVFHARASKEASAAGLQIEVARSEVNLGGIAHQLRRFKEALGHLDVAESLARELGNLRVLWFSLRNRFEVLDAIGEYRGALQTATSAARLAAQAGMHWHYLVSSAQAAAAHLELGQVDDALQCIEDALVAPRAGQFLNFLIAKLNAQRACALFRSGKAGDAVASIGEMERFLKLAGSEPDMDSQRWIQEARSHANA